MKPKFRYLTLIILTAGLAVFQTACTPTSQRAEEVPGPAAPAVPVQVTAVRRVPFDDSYENAGTVRADERAVIASKVMGTILHVSVNPGDRVRAGQPLIEIDGSMSGSQARQAEAALSAAEQGIIEAEKAQESAEADAHLASLTQQRFQQLLDKKAVSPHEFDQVEARLRSATAAREMAAARVQAARSQKAQAAAALESARTQLGYTRITAPFDGLVTEKLVDAGALAMPGVPLLAIEKATGYRLEAAVPETRMAKVKIGDPVKVSIPAAQLETAGRIVEIEPSTDAASRAFLVKISLPPDARVRTGMFGRAMFSIATTNLLAIPSQAIVRDGQLNSVFVVSDGKARRRLITLGRTATGTVEVLSGLQEGEQVVSQPATLTDGASVEFRP